MDAKRMSPAPPKSGLRDHAERARPGSPSALLPPRHEVTFAIAGKKRRKACRLILNCWWEQFDVRSFLQANLPEEDMAQVERASDSPLLTKC